jgi:hypothetical protein
LTIRKTEYSFSTAAVLLALGTALGLTAYALRHTTFFAPGECISELRGAMLIRWRPNEAPVLELGGSVTEVPALQKQGASPLAVLDINYVRTPIDTPFVGWFGFAHDKTTSRTWFDDSLGPDARRNFEASARELLRKTESGMTDVNQQLLSTDGESPSLRSIFYRRTTTTALAALAGALFLTGLRSAFINARRRTRAVRGQRLKCGYPLAPGAPCPECGASDD